MGSLEGRGIGGAEGFGRGRLMLPVKQKTAPYLVHEDVMQDWDSRVRKVDQKGEEDIVHTLPCESFGGLALAPACSFLQLP